MSSAEANCGECKRDELDGSVCERLSKCGVLTGLCEFAEAQEPEVAEPAPSKGYVAGSVYATHGPSRAEITPVNSDYL